MITDPWKLGDFTAFTILLLLSGLLLHLLSSSSSSSSSSSNSGTCRVQEAKRVIAEEYSGEITRLRHVGVAPPPLSWLTPLEAARLRLLLASCACLLHLPPPSRQPVSGDGSDQPEYQGRKRDFHLATVYTATNQINSSPVSALVLLDEDVLQRLASCFVGRRDIDQLIYPRMGRRLSKRQRQMDAEDDEEEKEEGTGRSMSYRAV